MGTQEPENYLLVLSELKKAILDGDIERFITLHNSIECTSIVENQRILNPIRSTDLVILACKYNKVKIVEYLFDNDSATILPDDEDEAHHNGFYYAIHLGSTELLDTLINQWPEYYFIIDPEELDKILSKAYEELKLKNIPLSDEMKLFVENKLINLRFFSNYSAEGENFTVEQFAITLKNINFVINALMKDNSNTEEVDKKFLGSVNFIAQGIHKLKRHLQSTYDRLPWEEMEFYLLSFISSHTIPDHTTLNKERILNHLDNFAKKLGDKNIQKAGSNCQLSAQKGKRSKSQKAVREQVIRGCPQFEELYNDYQHIKDTNTKERISLMLENIGFLQKNYANTEQVDEKFLFVAKFIAQNMHILKGQLQSTRDRLPWNEMEFCLICFISSRTKRQEINLFYHITLNKKGILKHLNHFAKQLEGEKNRTKSAVQKVEATRGKKPTREQIIAEIIGSYPQFKELYKDYQLIRDISSLEKISDNIKLASSADPEAGEGQIIITRALQVIGEHLKNTPESPKLSSITSDLFLLSLPSNARKIITEIRDSLSHADSLSKRMEIEEAANVNYFKNVQSDIKKIGDIIINIFYKKKFKAIRVLLQRFVDSENPNEIQEVADVLGTVELDEMILKNGNIMQHEKLKTLLKELRDCVADQTIHEKKLFDTINNILIKTQSQYTVNGYINGFVLLKMLSTDLSDNKIDHHLMKVIKNFASKTLKIITPNEMETRSITEIANLSKEIFDSVKSRTTDQMYQYEMSRLISKIYLITGSEIEDIGWIEELREKLNEKDSFAPKKRQGDACGVMKEKYNKQLVLKLSVVKNILLNNSLIFYKNDKKLQAVVEMLVLDILELILDCLENNLLYLDDNTPLLNGKCLRNHLAHHNAIVDILFCDPVISLILNAKKLTEENIQMSMNSTIGKLVSDNPFKLREKCQQSLATITSQKEMFAALEEGNLKIVKNCLKKGTDLKARNINKCTTLHFAAKGPNHAAIKFILGQNLSVDVKDNYGNNPLHIAAAHGRNNIVEFLIKETGLDVDDLNNGGKTPLHIAAQIGHKETVQVLLQHKANTVIEDITGRVPLHYAMWHNHIEVAKILLEADVNANNIIYYKGATLLHKAAEVDHPEMVNLLIQKNADVTAKTDGCLVPLHVAAMFGSEGVVNTLIENGADVNAIDLDDHTTLYYAVQSGHGNIVNILLNHGANIHSVDKTYKFTSLHYAAKDGNEQIVRTLLENGANAVATTLGGITPLHLAVYRSHVEIVAVLINHGVDVNAQDKSNWTPLHFAAKIDRSDVAEILIKNGAEINAKGNKNITALFLAVGEGHIDIVDLLIKNKAAVDDQITDYGTPLHAAAANGDLGIIDLLIQNGAEVNTKSSDDTTPLHRAAENGHWDVVDFLIRSDADVHAKTKINLTPLHFAVKQGHINVVKLLIEHHADVRGSSYNITPLRIAAEKGYKKIVDILIKKGAIVNIEGTDNMPLSYAIKYNHKEIVEVLIANGAGLNAETSDALSIAIFFGYTDIVEILLENETLINKKGNENCTPLHWAAKRGNKKIVNALIAKGADVNAKNIHGATPSDYAKGYGHEEIANILLNAGTLKKTYGVTPLHLGAKDGNDEIVTTLLQNGDDINAQDKNNWTPLHYSTESGHIEVSKTLIKNGAEINAKANYNITPLYLATLKGHTGVVDLLIQNKAVVNAQVTEGKTSLHAAAKNGSIDIMDLLVKNDAEVNISSIDGMTSLHTAAEFGHWSAVDFLIKYGANINATAKYDLTPLHCAVKEGNKEIVEILIESGANINIKSSDHTPLTYAVKCNHKEIVQVLLANGANLSEEISNAWSIAALSGYTDIVKILMKDEASINMKGHGDCTPLHWAVMGGCKEIVNTLISKGADVNAKSIEHYTPLNYAIERGHNVIANILLKYTANINIVKKTKIEHIIPTGSKSPSHFLYTYWHVLSRYWYVLPLVLSLVLYTYLPL